MHGVLMSKRNHQTVRRIIDERQAFLLIGVHINTGHHHLDGVSYHAQARNIPAINSRGLQQDSNGVRTSSDTDGIGCAHEAFFPRCLSMYIRVFQAFCGRGRRVAKPSARLMH